MIVEKALFLVQFCSQLVGSGVAVSGGVYVVAGWSGNAKWEQVQTRAEAAGVALEAEAYLPEDLAENDDLLKNPVFLRETQADYEDRLGDWNKLPGLVRANRGGVMNAAMGESFAYQDYFDEDLEEEDARGKLAAIAESFEQRLDKFAEVILSKPLQPVYAKLEMTDEGDGSGYMINGQNILTSLEASALMALRSGEPLEAIQKIEAHERLSGTFREANLIGCLIERAGRNSSDDVIWEGLRLRAWDDEQLARLSQLVAGREYEGNLKKALSYEASDMARVLEDVAGAVSISGMALSPKWYQRPYYWWSFDGTAGWKEHRKACVVNFYLELIDWIGEEDTERRPRLRAEQGFRFSPLSAVRSYFPMIGQAVKRYREGGPTKQRLVMAAMACERHFLKEGSYPKDMGALGLNFPLTDLTDPDLRDLAYKIGSEGRPVIWSRAEEAREKEQKRRKLRWQFSAFENEKKE